MRPLSLLALALLLGVRAASEPQSRPPKRAPQGLREKVCREGAYLSGPAAGARELGDAAERVGGAGEGPSLFRFKPPKEGCEESFDGFFAGHSGDFSIAPAVDEQGRPVTPEQAARRSVSLASLGRLGAADASAVSRFFDNKLGRADVAALAGFDHAAGRPQAPGNATFVNDGGERVPFEFSPPRPRLPIAGTVPDTREPAPLRPPSRPWSVPPSAQPVPEYGRARRWWNDFRAEVGDAVRGGPINAWEGGRVVLPRTPHVDVPPGSPTTRGFVALPNAPGLRPACRPGCYGTPKMMQLLVGMGAQFEQYFGPGQAMSVGGISLPQGGPFPPHVSHQVGLDVDISFAGGARGFDMTRNTLIVASVARQLPEFRKVNGRQYILVDASKHAALRYGLDQLVREGNLTPEQRERASGALTHWPNHNDHFHVRILP